MPPRDEDGLNAKEIKEILNVLKDTDVSELELERGGGVRLKIRRGPPPSTGPIMMTAPAQQATGPMPVASTTGSAPAAMDKPGKLITSPFVGTFYRAPSPDSPNYVEVGAAVKK